MSINWTTVETALHGWIVSASGLAGDHVTWAQQNKARPTGPFISMRITNVERVGQDWADAYEADDGTFFDRVQGVRRCTLSLQCFGGDAVGSSMPAAVLDQVVTKSRLPSLRAALQDAHVGIAHLGIVQSTDGVINSTLFEPRALLEVKFFLSQVVTESLGGGGVIDTIEITGSDEDDNTTAAYSVGAPTNVAASGDVDSVTLTWDAPFAVDSFRVFRGLTTDALQDAIDDGEFYETGQQGGATLTGLGAHAWYLSVVSMLGGVSSAQSDTVTATSTA